jgi:phosphotriesterase-related protein
MPTLTTTIVNTVLGSVPAEELGVVSVHEALLSVVPGAEYAYDVRIDRAEVFETLAAKLTAFKQAGGGTIIDSTGMYHGRDLPLLEALSRATGVHIVASTGLGPEALLGGYFLTPQTNPPTPWPADKFAELFAKEITEGMVVPRLERRGGAGLIATAVTTAGMTATDESLLRGAARAALATGVPVSLRCGADGLDVVLEEGLPAERIVVRGREDALGNAARGAYVGLTLADADLVDELIAAGHTDRVLLSSGGIGYAVGQPAHEVPYERVLTASRQILIDNPREFLCHV